MNWNWPGRISVAGPSAVQTDTGNDGVVAANTVKAAPGVLLKDNLNDPSAGDLKPVRLTDGAAGCGYRYMMLLVPAIPLAKTVTRVQPCGKLPTGADTKELLDQLAAESSAIRSPSMLRSWTTG